MKIESELESLKFIPENEHDVYNLGRLSHRANHGSSQWGIDYADELQLDYLRISIDELMSILNGEVK